MRIVKVLTLGGLLVLPAFGFAADRQNANNPIPEESQVKVKNDRDVNPAKSPLAVPDRKFVERAASDNMAEIELGRLALDKSQNPDVRNYAQTLVDDHQKSLDRLKSIANDQKYPLPTSSTTLVKQEYQRLSKLDGAEFDRAYLKLMSKRHAEAVDTFQKASNQLQNEDLKDYAQKTLPTLKQHKEMTPSGAKEQK